MVEAITSRLEAIAASNKKLLSKGIATSSNSMHERSVPSASHRASLSFRSLCTVCVLPEHRAPAFADLVARLTLPNTKLHCCHQAAAQMAGTCPASSTGKRGTSFVGLSCASPKDRTTSEIASLLLTFSWQVPKSGSLRHCFGWSDLLEHQEGDQRVSALSVSCAFPALSIRLRCSRSRANPPGLRVRRWMTSMPLG